MSYKVFIETLETHGRSLLRFLHVCGPIMIGYPRFS